MAVDEAPKSETAERIIRTWCRLKKRFQPVLRRKAGWGSGGGRLKDGVEVLVFLCGNERLCRSAPPPAAFFGYFLVRTQESDTYPLLERYDKYQFACILDISGD